MNPIIQLLKDENISDQQIADVFKQLTDNPMVAMAIISQMGIAQDKLQQLMMQVMTNPQLIQDAVAELGLDMDAALQAKDKFQQQQ
ncbi:DUF2999 family protein [Thalassotalea nanhaiensis]|uniref:DUF2999 family protein n=1 Tax=Thalassotalea nanhaiensis TaxID=3065648 RepID=A0ABY9TN19_9GAMM|nr:DUF2999 family protein [Colwelliaceae bacterium SQ345]